MGHAVITEPRPLDPAEWARVHDGSDPGNFVFRRGVQLAAAWCADSGTDAGSWLDAGSGTGHLAAALARTGARVIGVDRSIAMASYSERRWSGGTDTPLFAAADVSELPFRDSSFDGIVGVSLLGCVARSEQVFRECARLVRPRGILCVSATNRHSIPLAVIGAVRRLRSATTNIERYAAYDPRRLEAELRRAGFIVERQLFYGRFGLPARLTAGLEHEVRPGARSIIASNVLVMARRES